MQMRDESGLWMLMQMRSSFLFVTDVSVSNTEVFRSFSCFSKDFASSDVWQGLDTGSDCTSKSIHGNKH